jgi:hypothetical protein
VSALAPWRALQRGMVISALIVISGACAASTKRKNRDAPRFSHPEAHYGLV